MGIIAIINAIGATPSSNNNQLPADYWQEETTDYYFIEEETGLVLTL